MEARERIRELRKKNNVSFRELANKIGLSKSYLHSLEKGMIKNPSFDMLSKLAKEFGVTVEYLVTNDSDIETTQDMAMFLKYKSISHVDRDKLHKILHLMEIR